jgi:hypothetical protein
LSHYGEYLARVNGMLEKIEFEKNDKQNLLFIFLSYENSGKHSSKKTNLHVLGKKNYANL